mmetsp:Transcript_145257/g.253518  ORF Transcript_145257/g.253518 Transcript_145257/m.253518 type:complete len:290 (+) Transcript_145257:96-965(+)
MAELKSVELLGVGVAAIFVSIFWGGAVSVRALLVVVAGVTALDFLRPLWHIPECGKSTEKDELSANCSPSLIAAAVASMSVVAATVNAAFRSLAQRVAGFTSVQVLTACLTAFLISCAVKALGIPGYPWNCLPLGVFQSWCFRRFMPERHQSEQPSEIDVGDCPYSSDFWKELGTIEFEEEEEVADDLGDTYKLMAEMREKGATMKEDGDQEEASTEADKEDEEDYDEDDEEEEYEGEIEEQDEDAGGDHEIKERGDGEVYNLFEKLTIAYDLFEISQPPHSAAPDARG